MSIIGVAVILVTTILLAVLIGLAIVKPLRRWDLFYQQRAAMPLAVIGILGGLVGIVLILRIGNIFGFPGSEDYQIYERFNRIMAFVLAFQASAILSFISANFEKLDSFSQSIVAVILGGWISMVIGTAAEFWLFSSLSYAEINLRSFSFGLFSMGSLVAALFMFILGFRILRRRLTAMAFGLVFILYLPVDAAFFVRGDSIFLAPALGAVLIGILVLIQSRGSTYRNGAPA